MKWAIKCLIFLAFVAALGWPAARLLAAARDPELRIAAPARVAVGGQIELTIALGDAAGLGGYQAELRFDGAAAHFNGMEHQLDPLRQNGRDAGPLGAVERAGGIAFGAYS